MKTFIESYDFGSVVINGVEYTSDIVVMGEKIKIGWRRKEGHMLHTSDFKDAMEEFLPEVVIIGTGYSGMMKVPAETEQYLRTKRVKLLVEKTEKACKLFNTLSKSKRVLAALHLTC